MTKYWAILIGINFYVKDKCLEGCVRDVGKVKQYLAARPMPVNVKSFTASTPSDSNSCYPTEPLDRWPTYENVTSSIKTITDDAKRGDLVYVHYSGHGTRMKELSRYSNKNTGDLALVLFDDVHGSRYLRGLELAELIHAMVEKGLLVTIVFDCCFSGNVVRYGNPHHGDGVRATDYDHAVDTAYPQDLGIIHRFQFNPPALRDAHIMPTWLVNPSGYTILTACGPHEIAKELELEDGGEKSGVLTHFLFRALKSMWKSDVDIKHQSLYQHLCARFHASWPQQTPMRYGNKDLSFFGKLTSGTDTTFISIFMTRKDSCLRLEAGRGHGVCLDDEYALYPFDSSESVCSNTSQAPVKARVSTVRGLTSDLVVLDSTSNQSQVKPGWKARLLTRLSPYKVPIRILAREDHQTQRMAAANQRRFLSLFSGDDEKGQPFLFNVTRNERNEYEILNESCQRIISLPKIPLGQTGAWNCLVKVLEHLATFKYFEGIENRSPSASFEKSFTLNLSDAVGSNLETAGFLDVTHESELSLTFQNESDMTLYLALFDLGPSWQIDSLLCSSGGGDFIVVPPKNDGEGYNGKVEIRWSMNVPESLRNLGQCQCEDVLKIFVTSKWTMFTTVMMREISKSAEDLDGSMRSDDYDQLSRFLSELKADPFRGTKDDLSDEEWIARNFLIRTTVTEMSNT